MNKQGEGTFLLTSAFLSRGGILGLVLAAGTVFFVILTGLGIWLGPFSVTSQMTVLFHTLAGLFVLVPLTFWLLSHWLATRKSPRTVSKVCAYIGFWLLAANIIGGTIITYQAIFGLWSSHFWTEVHRWTGILVIPFLVLHVLPRSGAKSELAPGPSGKTPPRDSSARQWIWTWSVGTAVIFFIALAAAAASYHSADFASYTPPPSFQAAPGANPFAPSHAQTGSGKPVPPEIISDSRACGAPGCHTAIYQEWRASAHRWSEEDQLFQTVRTATTEVQGVKVTEKCGGCHAPVSLLSGYKDPTLGSATSGYAEGDSCVVCHAVQQVDERGIGSYILGIPKGYLYEHNSAAYASFINHFLIRVYPRQHDRDYNLKIAREAESCAPCHKEYDVVGKYPGLLQVETQYDDWKHRKWNTDRDPARRLRCQQCHMFMERAPERRLADPYDLAVGLGLEYHNHRFAAANQFMPQALGSPGAEEQIRRVGEWLTGKKDVPEIQTVWPRGPIVPVKIEAPASVRPGATLDLRVILTNNKAGHSFPTGPLNVVRVWIELEVYDRTGKKVFHSGELDRENHVEADSYVIRPIALTESGRAILTPDIWHPDGLQFRPAINPGESESFAYRCPVPRDAMGPLLIRARLRYRKANQFFMDEVYAPRHVEAPVTDISSASEETAVVGSATGSPDQHGRP